MDVGQLARMYPMLTSTTFQTRPSGVAGAQRAPVSMEPMPEPLPSETVTPVQAPTTADDEAAKIRLIDFINQLLQQRQ